MLSLREVVISVGDGDWIPEQREAVEKVVDGCVPLHDRVPELQEAARRVAVRSTVRDVAVLLEQAVAVLHHEALKMGLMRAEAVGEEVMSAHSALLKTAKALDAKLDSVREGLRLGVKAVKLDQLRVALTSAQSIGLTHYEQPAAASLAKQIERVLARASEALHLLDLQMMAQALGEADAFTLRDNDVESIRKYLAMPTEKFLTEQLKLAMKLGQEERQDELQMQIKMHFFERAGRV